MGRRPYTLRMESGQVLFVLASASQGIKAEAALRAAGVTCALIPVPRTLSSHCGVCLRVPGAERAQAEAVLDRTGTMISTTHETDGGPGEAAAAKETR
jgi:hypothetical protein